MPAIDWITIKGFRSIASIEKLSLRNINVIIGSNGSGKSNFIGVFSFLNAVREGRLKEYVGRAGGANSILHFGSKATPSLSIHVAFSNGVNQYKIELVPTENDGLIAFAESAYYWDKSRYPSPYELALASAGSEAGISEPQSSSIPHYVQDHLSRWRVYHFHDTSRTAPMKQTCDVEDNRFLRADASNISAFLYRLREQFPDNYTLIVRTVRQVAPFFEDFVLEPSALNEEKIRLEWKHESTDAYFSASALSDGTIRFIALATLLLQPTVLRPSVIIIDEPELGLHPYALTMLASMVQQASLTTQIVISTQSALLLDNFEPEDVLVADRIENGTQLRRLPEGEYDDWLEEYSLGQLWEKAEFGGRPSSTRARLP